jgi:predicted esterase
MVAACVLILGAFSACGDASNRGQSLLPLAAEDGGNVAVGDIDFGTSQSDTASTVDVEDVAQSLPNADVAPSPPVEDAASKGRTDTSAVAPTLAPVVYGQGRIDTAWGTKAGKSMNLLLDIYQPKAKAVAKRPAIVLIHGGGFTGGTRKQGAIVAIAKYFARRGWFAVSVDYRLAKNQGPVPKAWAEAVKSAAKVSQAMGIYPAGRDCKAAVRWVHANADKYQVDTDRISATGGSAGAVLAVMLGTSFPGDFRDELGVAEDPTLKSTHMESAAEIAVVIDLWGSARMVEILKSIDGKERFDKSDAPLAIIHGTKDSVVAFKNAEQLRDQYIKTGALHAFYPLEGAGHGAWKSTYKGKALSALAFDFMVKHLGLNVSQK